MPRATKAAVGNLAFIGGLSDLTKPLTRTGGTTVPLWSEAHRDTPNDSGSHQLQYYATRAFHGKSPIPALTIFLTD
jgi:hypothetical protein